MCQNGGETGDQRQGRGRCQGSIQETASHFCHEKYEFWVAGLAWTGVSCHLHWVSFAGPTASAVSQFVVFFFEVNLGSIVEQRMVEYASFYLRGEYSFMPIAPFTPMHIALYATITG